jgi:hypothetical protein
MLFLVCLHVIEAAQRAAYLARLSRNNRTVMLEVRKESMCRAFRSFTPLARFLAYSNGLSFAFVHEMLVTSFKYHSGNANIFECAREF